MQITDVDGIDNHGNCLSGDTVRFKLDYECHADNLSDPLVAIAVNTLIGECYLYLSTELLGIHPVPIKKSGSFIFSIASLPLASGQYSISVWISFKGNPADWVMDAGILTVEDGDFFGSGRVMPRSHGRFLVDHSFDIQ